MKNPVDKVTLLLLVLLVEARCGVVDDIVGKVKDTTNALGQDVKNVWSYSKTVVGLETENEDNGPKEEKRGLIGGLLHTTKEKIHSAKNYLWNTEEGDNDAGVFGNMYKEMKDRLRKLKGVILGGENPSPSQPPTEQEKLIKKTLNKLFFGNGTRKTHGRAFQEVIDNLKKTLDDIRSNITGSTENPVHHGEGMIDVRKLDLNLEDNTESVDIYETDVVDKITDKAADATAKANKLLQDNVNKISRNVKNSENKVKEAVDEVKKNTS